MGEDYLFISGIQHFCFCRRQWALIHIENYWKENLFTAEGKELHDRVHNESLVTKKNGIITIRGVPVKSARLKVTGACDAVELIPDDKGINLQGRPGKWQLYPVEYKRGRKKEIDCDLLQLTTEIICLEEMLSCRIEKGAVFYWQTRHREEVIIDDELRNNVESMIKEMWDYYNRHYTPKARPGKKCKCCSLNNYCLPVLEEKVDVRDYIKKHIYEIDQ